MFSCFHENTKGDKSGHKKGLGGKSSPAPSPCTVIAIPGCPVGRILPEASRPCPSSSCPENPRGARGADSPSLAENLRASARSNFSVGTTPRHAGAARAAVFSCRRQGGRAGDRRIAFSRAGLDSGQSLSARHFESSSQIANSRGIPRPILSEGGQAPERSEGALMRCLWQQRSRLPSGSPNPPPRSQPAWRSTTLP